ncbi:MAG: rod-binding protein [Lachnospiraceae bacterium]|nr:rod-binding protein [Lachnospiraceae bacterium]
MELNPLNAMSNIQNAESNSAAKLRHSLGNTNFSNSTDEELLTACKEFEAYFLEMVFKEMQKSVDLFADKKDQSTSQMVEYFRDQTIQKIASDATESQGLGLAQQLFEAMKRNYNI